jgi:hypothetical protein
MLQQQPPPPPPPTYGPVHLSKDSDQRPYFLNLPQTNLQASSFKNK